MQRIGFVTQIVVVSLLVERQPRFVENDPLMKLDWLYSVKILTVQLGVVCVLVILLGLMKNFLKI
jgi:hypothetical protein